jgi:hypothetical protein
MRDPFRSVICASVEVLYGRQQCSGARSISRGRFLVASSSACQCQHHQRSGSMPRVGGAVDPIPQTPLFLWSSFDFLSRPPYKGAR